MANAPAAQQQNPVQQNLAARAILLQTGTPMKKLLGTFGPYNLGQQVQIPLDRMGIFTQLECLFSATVTIATDSPTPSPFGLYPLINTIKYTDFNAVDRVNTSGPMLYCLNSMRLGKLFLNAYTSQAYGGVGAVDTNQYFQPTATGTSTAYWALRVPLAYDPKQDLRGAVLAQTVVGDHYLKLQFGSLSSGDVYNAPYSALNGGTTTVSNIYVTVFEHYIQPQNLQMLPAMDLSTIYGVEGNYASTANLASNTPFYVNWPNNRSILQAIHIYENNGTVTLNGTDLGEVDLIANANTQIRQETPQTLREAVRNHLGGDLPSGTYVIDARKNPIATTLYGNVQTKFNVITANSGSGPTQFITQYEDFYPAGVPLPGIAAGSQ